MRCRFAALAIGIASLAMASVPARAIQLSPEIKLMYELKNTPPPTSRHMTVCYGFVCRLRVMLYFTPADRAALTGMLAKGRSSPGAERKSIQAIFQWFDRRVGGMVGTSRRVARADFRAHDDDHNFDCFDTTRNAVSLLLVLQDWGALRYHVVSDPRFRGNFLVGQTPHNTAVITDKTTRQKWVVDMWTVAYGQVPDVMPLEKWLKEE